MVPSARILGDDDGHATMMCLDFGGVASDGEGFKNCDEIFNPSFEPGDFSSYASLC
jgi:hypothetical protein